ncbi:MAG: DUF6519 domain-containing protein [Azoarcus sp.]|jgi:sugar lactone lactonase YvrE|nr:DUF6519 domain-containing protein [Azoarcus sp.]
MKGDFSRFSFDPKKHYRAVLMQQGRLQLDADWNEQVQMAEHRYNAFFRAMVGRSGTPGNMEMSLSVKEGKLILSKGVYYIDGLLIENESPIEQNIPTENESYLYYIDAWEREVSAAEDSDLIDPAVGVETTTRLKTEWALRYEKINVGEKLKERYLAGEWPGASSEWPELSGNWWQPRSTGTLQITKNANSESDNTESSDNRLYRIEVHPGLESKSFYFKWSRDNASVCAEVTANGNNTFKLKNKSANIQNAFTGAPWIELCYSGKTMGIFGTYQFENDTIILPGADDCFSLVMEDIGKEMPLIIRRWDGVFSEAEKNSLADELNATLTFATDAFYRTGDYWLILVRNGEIVNWPPDQKKEPDGTKHHFAALGITKADKSLVPLHLLFYPLTNADLNTHSNVAIGGHLAATTGNFTQPANVMELLFFAVAPQSLDFDSGVADQKTVNLFSKTNWKASSNASWCTVTPESGSNNASVSVKVTENSTNVARSAMVTFTSADGLHTRTLNVTQPKLLTPVISGFIPSEAPHGGALSIFGANFHPAAAKNAAKLNGIPASIVAASAMQLTVTVPKGMNCSGNITVEVGSKISLPSAAGFTYVPTIGVSTLAGSTAGYADYTGTAAKFNCPLGIAIDSSGNLYVADYYNNCIRKVTPKGEVSTLAGSSMTGSTDGTGTAARFNRPWGITTDASGNLYVADYRNRCIRKITLQGKVDTLDIFGDMFPLDSPRSIAMDASRNLYVIEGKFSESSHYIRKIVPQTSDDDYHYHEPATLAGDGWKPGYIDGQAMDARFNLPCSIAVDKSGNLYVADGNNHCIRKVVTSTGVVSTLAGDGTAGFTDGTGRTARFNRPHGIGIDKSGNLYVAEGGNHSIRKVTSKGVVTTIAGNGTAGSADGTGTAARFNRPYGIIVDDDSGSLYVTDMGNYRIRKITFE